MLKSELYVSGVIVDLLDDVTISLNYNIANIREPDKRDAAFSKTISIPGSKGNNKLFSHIFNINKSVQTSGTINFAPDFNPNLKAPAILLSNGIEVFNGIIQLQNINILDEDRIDYDVILLGKLSNIFVSIGEQKLTDLDLSAYNHTYSKTNQVNSLSTFIVKNGSNYAFTLGEGYVYPMIDYGFTDGNSFNVNQQFPSIYVKQYIDKIFALVGFSYTSSFFNSDFFKRLIVPFNSENLKLNETSINQRTFSATKTADINSTVLHPQIRFTVQFDDTGASDPNLVYNPTTGKWTVNRTGTYNVKTLMTLQLQYNPSIPSSKIVPKTIWGYINVRINNSTTALNQAIFSFDTNNAIVSAGALSVQIATYVNVESKLLTAGDNVYVDIVCYQPESHNFKDPTTGIFIAGDIQFIIKAGATFYNEVVNNNLLEGDNLSLNFAIPTEVKIKDFFNTIIKAFNLYIDDDKSVSNNLLIEPRDSFYTSGVIDYSDKLDISQPLVIQPMGDLDTRTFIYSYKADEDYYNKKYKDTYNEIYGWRKVDTVNDFVKDEKKTELIFSPTPLVERPDNDRIIPKIFSIDSNNKIVPKKSNIRMLYYGGIKTTAQSWKYISTSGLTNETTYGYAGHLDSPQVPTIDINFGVPKEVYYTATQYTNNNLFNVYYKKFLDEITDKDSKIVTGYFYITPSDIFNIDFRKVYYFQDNYFRLNKVFDYSPTEIKLTKCEFLKIKDAPTFVSTVKSVVGAPRVAIGEEVLPLLAAPFKAGANVYADNGSNNINVQGTDNYVAASSRNISIVGTQNTVYGDASNISLQGSSGVIVLAGVSNVSAIGSSGIIIYESNVAYVGNVKFKDGQAYPAYDLIDGGLNEVRNIRAVAQYHLIDGGENEVRSIASESPVQTIDGGLN